MGGKFGRRVGHQSVLEGFSVKKFFVKDPEQKKMFLKILASLSTIVAVVVAVGGGSNVVADDCRSCFDVRLESTGPFAEMYPRYTGIWTR